MKKLLPLIVPMLLTACATQIEPFNTQNIFQTNVVLTEANYVILRQVEGSSSRCFNSGIARNEAIAEMIENADLRGSQAIINITVSQTDGTFCDRAKATGTVIEFFKTDGNLPNNRPENNQGEIKKKIQNEKKMDVDFSDFDEPEETSQDKSEPCPRVRKGKNWVTECKE